jgi:hypothetical protein
VRKWHVGGAKHSLDRRGGLPHYFPYARDELRCICCCQFHSLASACAVLLSHARSIRVVEKPDFAHTRACVRYPLDKVLRKGGDSAFWGISTRAGRPRDSNLAREFLSARENCTCAKVEPGGAGTSDRTCACKAFLSLVDCSLAAGGQRTCFAHTCVCERRRRVTKTQNA